MLSLNPLSRFLQHAEGYAYGKKRRQQLTHNYFVDDLKLYSANMNNLKHQFDILAAFLKDIGMVFGVNQFAYVHIEKGKFVKSEPLSINKLTIHPAVTDGNYRYLEMDENIE